MQKLAIALAGLAAIGFSGVAFADEATTTNGPAAMTDAEMDGVTAAGQPDTKRSGLISANQAAFGAAGNLVIPEQAPEGRGLGQGERVDDPGAP